MAKGGTPHEIEALPPITPAADAHELMHPAPPRNGAMPTHVSSEHHVVGQVTKFLTVESWPTWLLAMRRQSHPIDVSPFGVVERLMVTLPQDARALMRTFPVGGHSSCIR
jgi:hypothetical protein